MKPFVYTAPGRTRRLRGALSGISIAGLLVCAAAAPALALLAVSASGGTGSGGGGGGDARTSRDAAGAAQAGRARPAVVLVHGAFADGSSWGRVIPLLQRKGYRVTAVQNALTSLADDVATTRRAIEAQKGPVVLVGHSYGGVVVTEAAAGNPNVKALVYVAAYAPDSGESVASLNDRFPTPPIASALAPLADGFLSVDPARFREVFCADLPASEAAVLAATQRPVAAACLSAPAGAHPAWKEIPSWCVVSRDDRATLPELQRFMAARSKARVTEVKSSHVPFLSHPEDVAEVIEAAAAGAP